MTFVALDGKGQLVNRISNPSFEFATTGWTPASCTIAVGTEHPQVGTKNGRIDPTSAGWYVYANDGVALSELGQAFTASIYVYGAGSAVGKHLTLICREQGVGDSSTVITIGAGMQRVVATRPSTQLGSQMQLIVYDATSEIGAGIPVYIDAAQLEAGRAATAYCDGDQPGCQWDGSAHLSATWRGLVLPLIEIAVDVTNDPTNPTRVWTDITPKVREVTYARSGRSDELQRTNPGTLVARCDNRDDGITGLGIRKRQWIRVRAKWNGVTYPRWQGIMESLPRSWPSLGKDAEVELRAADVLKVARLYPLDGLTFAAQRNDQRVSAIASAAGIPAGTVDTDTDDADAIVDPFPENSDGLSLMVDIEGSENGLLIAEPDGKLSFQGRHWRAVNSRSSLGTFGEATNTNECYPDSSFETDTTGWSGSGSPARTNAWARDGSWSYLIDYSPTNNDASAFGPMRPCSAGDVKTVSAYLNVLDNVSAGVKVRIQFWDAPQTTMLGFADSAAFTGTGVTRLSASGTAPASTAYYSIRVVMGNNSGVQRMRYYVDAVQYEAGSVATLYTSHFPEIPYNDNMAYQDDDTLIANVVAVTPAGGTPVVRENTASQAKYWKSRLNRTLQSSDVTLATDASNYLLSLYADPRPRVPQLELSLLAVQQKIPSAVAMLLAAGNSQRFTFKRASTNPIKDDVYIEQVSERLAPMRYDMQFQLSPASDQDVWIAEDPVLGLAGVSTRAGY